MLPAKMTDPKYHAVMFDSDDPLSDADSVRDVPEYMEAQMHGGVTLNDVDHVHFHDREPDMNMIEQLGRRGLKWKNSAGQMFEPHESYRFPNPAEGEANA